MQFQFKLSTIILLIALNFSYGQESSYAFSANVEVSESIKDQFKNDGRFFLFLSRNMKAEPRTQTWPSPTNKTYIFAKNINGLNSNTKIEIGKDENWTSTSTWDLDNVPEGEYNVQVLWDQDFEESRIDAPGNLYSTAKTITINQTTEVDLVIDKAIAERKVSEHPLAIEVDIKSEFLSNWWSKDVHLKASVLLPHGYDNTKTYPIIYDVAGYGGRYTRVNYILNNQGAMAWWDSPMGPKAIVVFLDGEGPFGDSYQLDSENSGPYGEALTKELIPHIESKYRGTDSAGTRFVQGCSTGGWVSLALQIYYPDFFNGAFSYSPDAIDFENYQLINIYTDKNAYTNEFGYLRPVMRSTSGEPMLSLKEFIQYENVLGYSGTYLNSGGQFSAHTALYSPKGDDGLPQPLFDPITGDMNPSVAEHWKKYDLKLYAKTNWEELGPKLQGKIFISMGDMDDFYLNTGTRGFADFLSKTENPKSDAEIIFTPMEGHCTQYFPPDVFKMVQDRIDELEKE